MAISFGLKQGISGGGQRQGSGLKLSACRLHAYTENHRHPHRTIMGNITSHEALALRWAELCNDPQLRDLPGKVELNGFGVIEMSPASNRHAFRQAAIGHALSLQLPAGAALVECSIATTDGVRVPDVAWASSAFIAQHGDVTPFPAAPEICVEVRSPANSDAEMALKTRLFLEAGAVEVWIISEDGAWQVFDASGAQQTSRFAVQLELALPARR